MTNTWVVVAETSRAKVFTADAPGAPLRELEDLVHPEGRLHEGDLTMDQPGRAFDSVGGQRHAMGTKVSPHEQEALDFAHEIAARLEAARTHHAFQKLILVAGPPFLGVLRDALSAPTRDMITEEVRKNLVQHSVEDIRAHLSDRL